MDRYDKSSPLSKYVVSGMKTTTTTWGTFEEAQHILCLCLFDGNRVLTCADINIPTNRSHSVQVNSSENSLLVHCYTCYHQTRSESYHRKVRKLLWRVFFSFAWGPLLGSQEETVVEFRVLVDHKASLAMVAAMCVPFVLPPANATHACNVVYVIPSVFKCCILHC